VLTFTLSLATAPFRPNISTEVGGLYAPGDHLGKMYGSFK
jgi:hypothetical protein